MEDSAFVPPVEQQEDAVALAQALAAFTPEVILRELLGGRTQLKEGASISVIVVYIYYCAARAAAPNRPAYSASSCSFEPRLMREGFLPYEQQQL